MKGRITMLVFAVLAMALAVPALASASEWTQEGEPIEGEQTIELEGDFAFLSAYGNFQCTVQGEAKLVPGGGGELDLAVTSTPCNGHFFGCDVTAELETPWPMEARANDIFVSDASQKWFVSNECGSMEVPIEGTMELTPDNQFGMSTLHLEGMLEETNTFSPLLVTGELEVSPAEVYGFE